LQSYGGTDTVLHRRLTRRVDERPAKPLDVIELQIMAAELKDLSNNGNDLLVGIFKPSLLLARE
jgi:hypothetical protein